LERDRYKVIWGKNKRKGKCREKRDRGVEERENEEENEKEKDKEMVRRRAHKLTQLPKFKHY
jgi:hypothetical protein